jgi:hypothetical protein
MGRFTALLSSLQYNSVKFTVGIDGAIATIFLKQ